MKQPTLTPTPIDPSADRSKRLGISSTFPTEDASSASDGNSSRGVNRLSGAPLSEAERERQARLGALLVNLDAAKEEEVFGPSGAEVMRVYREHRAPDLLVINRREDDASQHPICWYKPWTWWTGGAQVSPMIWEDTGRSLPPLPSNDAHPTETTVEKEVPRQAVGKEVFTQTMETNEPVPEVAVETPPPVVLTELAVQIATEEAERLNRSGAYAQKKRGVPPVSMLPLTEEQLNLLTPTVREDRVKMLKAEENIHKTLQGIEDTRYKYLVPSTDIACEREVAEVTLCYARENAAAAAEKASRQQARAAEVAKGYSNQVEDEGVEKPIVLFNVLRCGPKVAAMKACTERMLSTYSDGEVQ